MTFKQFVVPTGSAQQERGTALLVAHFRARLARQEGQALVEYALIVSLIAIVCVGVITLAGASVSTIFSNIAHAL